jgi:hypothetical protein
MKVIKSLIENLYETKFLPKVVKDMGHDGETNNHELHDQGKAYFKEHFKGVFLPKSMTDLPKILSKENDCCIFNTSSKGVHWVAFARGEDGIQYYDSFGRPFSKLFKDKVNLTSTEEDAEQKYEEENCGQRCLAYLLIHRLHGEAISRFI